MRMRRFPTPTTCLVGLLALALATACGGKATETADAGGGGGGGGGGTSANLVGQVSLTASASSSRMGNLMRSLGFGANAISAISGCTVSVYDLTSAAVIATGTSDSTGKFVVSSGGLTAGKSYKVVADCGLSGKFTAIIGADTKDPNSK